jgi:hypothetical protein
MLQAFRSRFKCRPIEQQTRGIRRSAIRAWLSSDPNDDSAACGHYALHQIAYDLMSVADKSWISFPAG